ncbi:Uncharacterised protein [Ewingella americana]|uniref:Uncharacterized protein n=1 Tax=Ewingella americana TaxID=41202 RepID=A0A377N9N7_9GAMM|nr:Uncharacterised protein [Ewingella americana]
MNTRSSKIQAAGQFWPEIEMLITREGKEVDISDDIWRLPYSARDNSTLNFKKIINSNIRESFKGHVADRLKRISTHAGYAVYQDVWREVLRHWGNPTPQVDTESHLIDLFEIAINRARSQKNYGQCTGPYNGTSGARTTIQNMAFRKFMRRNSRP